MTRDRALATALGYVLTLGITAILVSGLLVAGGGFVEDEREDVIQTELQAVGEQIASHIMAADRLNQSGAGTTYVNITQPFPPDVTGTSYQITLVEQKDPVLRLESSRPTITTEIGLANTTAVSQSTATGGSVLIQYDPDRNAVVISDA